MSTHTIGALVLAATVAGMTGCSSISTSTDFDKNAKFSSYKTFAWMPPARAPASTPFRDLTDRRASDAISSALNKQGLRLATPPQKPDLYVAFGTVTNEWSYDYPLDSWGCGSVRCIDTWNSARSRVFENTFQVALIDTATKKTVWVGVANKSDSNGLLDQETVDEAVKKLLAEYPPENSQ